MIVNDDFMLIEEYDNISSLQDLNLTIRRLCPHLFHDRFLVYSQSNLNKWEPNFFVSNHITAISTNNREKLNKLLSNYTVNSWTTDLFSHFSNNKLEVYWQLFKQDNVHNFIIIFYVPGYQIKRHTIPYSKVQDGLSYR